MLQRYHQSADQGYNIRGYSSTSESPQSLSTCYERYNWGLNLYTIGWCYQKKDTCWIKSWFFDGGYTYCKTNTVWQPASKIFG